MRAKKRTVSLKTKLNALKRLSKAKSIKNTAIELGISLKCKKLGKTSIYYGSFARSFKSSRSTLKTGKLSE